MDHTQTLQPGSRRRGMSNGSTRHADNGSLQSSDPFQGLEQWESVDLIQLSTPRLSPTIVPTGSQLNSLQSSTRIRPQPSLLDLDDDCIITETDARLAERLREQSLAYGAAKAPTRHSSIDQLSCDQCDKTGIPTDYCNVCDLSFCSRCWDFQIAHKRRMLAPGSIPHEKTDHTVAKKIKRTLESHITNEDDRKLLHQQDEDKTWFGILREDNGFPSFQDYGRYANLMAESSRSTMSSSGRGSGSHDSRYPSLVSFVGQTGAGKSTVIKLVIDLQSTHEGENATPVVGSAGEWVPTSGDVHLYPDPLTFESDTPILYADCEGLEGGEREPLATRFRKKGAKISKVGRVGSFEKRMQRIPNTSERCLTWADTNVKRGREFAVTNLYPRLLYTFSDVVVFVLKNPRVIESVLEKLVTWAAAALEKSSNQPVLPHAIVVLNASENDIDPTLWDVDTATEKLLHSLSETVSQNAAFKKYALFWKERSRNIKTVEDLLLSYYSSFRVVRIPTSGRPNLISEQIGKLYQGIRMARASSQERRLALRMLLDANELQAYLQYAFDHFACTLDSPFDFVQASFTNSPIPLDFGGNILKLAINLMEALPNQIDGPMIFKELSTMVASCIMLDSARHKIRGTADQIFPQYLEHIEAALENFTDRHWPCEYIKPGGGARCVNVRSGHGSKGHQLKNGKVLAVGNYMSHFSFENYRETFAFDVYSQLSESLALLHLKMHDSRDMEAHVAAEIHASTVMKHFHLHTVKAGAESFISHSTCFSCLFEPPEHPLPCGHVLCTSCLRAYGRVTEKNVVELDGCPIESLSKPRHQTWKVVMKPPDAGIRVLTLDGGGIRGIVELEVLRLIEQALGGRIPIRTFFDLVVGTSTGGIIALGLVAKKWSVEACTSQFESLCHRAFTRRTGASIPGIGFLVSYYNHSQYETRPLEEALVGAYGEEDFLFGGSRFLLDGDDGNNAKVGVVTTSATNLPVILTNYNRSCSEKLSYHFQRPEKLQSELKIWEAARATSAAPMIFKPFHHEPSKQVYMDGAIYHNNPIQIADKERKNLWPSLPSEYPDVLVSIGTSYGPPRAAKELSSPPPQVGVFSHGKSLYKIAVDHIATARDSEKAWEDYMSILQPPQEHLSRFVRLNPQLLEDPPRVDDVECLQQIKATARAQMMHNERIPVLALQLVASCFYFEKSAAAELQPDDTYECKGEIHCRLPPESEEISELGKLLREKMAAGRNLAFIVQEKHRGQNAESREITPATIDRMIGRRRFSLGRITLSLSSKLAVTEIFLTVNPGELLIISGFPRSLLQDEGVRERTRQITNATSRRWAGRTASRRTRQSQWTPPDLGHRPQRSLSTYSQDEYVLGNSTPSAMKRIASLFRKGPNRGRHEESKGKAEAHEGPMHLRVPTGLNTSAYETPDDLGVIYPVELPAGDWTPTQRSPGPSTSPSIQETEALPAELEGDHATWI